MPSYIRTVLYPCLGESVLKKPQLSLVVFFLIRALRLIVKETLNKPVKRASIHLAHFSNLSLRDVSFEHFADKVAFGVELIFVWCVASPFWPSQHHALLSFACQGFFGALTDEVAFYFGREAEGKGQDFALDVVAQAVVVFDGPHAAFLVHADVQDFHNHEKVAAETRKFGADNKVVLLYAFQQFAQFAFVIGFCATDGFLYPAVNVHAVPLAEVVDFEALVLHRLLVATHSDVSVNHNVNVRLKAGSIIPAAKADRI